MSTPTYLLPVWNATQFFDNNGNILAFGQIYQYEGGSFTVEQTTYTGDTTSTSPNTNPIILDVNGRIDTEMWGPAGLAYNLQLTDVNGLVLQEAENVIGIEPSFVPTNSNVAINVWNISATPTYLSGSEFLVPGNVTANYAIGNRVQFINGTGTYGYGTVSNVTYTSPNTYVTIQPDTISIGSNLSAVYWSSLVAAAHGSTVDAGGVAYSTELTYSNLATVGGQISNLDSQVLTILTNRVTPGAYIQANVTVDSYGFITAIATGNKLTTKGDLEGYSTGLVRIPVGVDGDVLTANSANAAGVQWEAPFNAALVNGASANLDRTGSDGYIADPSLTVALAANTVYNITCFFDGYSPSAGVYVGMNYTGSFAHARWALQWSIDTTGGNGGCYAVNSSYLFASGWTSEIMITMIATIYTTSAGNFSVAWGNAGAGGNVMTRYEGSGISAIEVA